MNCPLIALLFGLGLVCWSGCGSVQSPRVPDHSSMIYPSSGPKILVQPAKVTRAEPQASAASDQVLRYLTLALRALASRQEIFEISDQGGTRGAVSGDRSPSVLEARVLSVQEIPGLSVSAVFWSRQRMDILVRVALFLDPGPSGIPLAVTNSLRVSKAATGTILQVDRQKMLEHAGEWVADETSIAAAASAALEAACNELTRAICLGRQRGN